MKKFLIVVSVASIVACAAVFLSRTEDERSEKNIDVVLASTEALARGEGASGLDNSGPAKVVKCGGGEHRKLCMCTNSKSCTETECF